MYDICMIGGGPAGYTGAIKAARLGMKTALVEADKLGGTCLNRGCIPTKALLHSADAYRNLEKYETMGIRIDGSSFDYERMHACKDETVTRLRDGVGALLKGNGVDVYPGRALVTAPARGQAEPDGQEAAAGPEETGKEAEPARITVSRDGEAPVVIEARSVVLATGCYPSIPPIPGADDKDVFTSDELLTDATRFYKRLVIIGGGVIGMEMAGIYRALHCEVTVLEAMDRILPMMDREISQNLAMILKKRGVAIQAGASVTGIRRTAEGLVCSYDSKKGSGEVVCDGVLISVGRRPATKDLFTAEGPAPELTPRGFVSVGDSYETSLPGIYAVGDCNGLCQLAHAAEAQAMACMEYIAGKEKAAINPSVVPSCVYTDPEIACVGLTADDAKKQGIPVLTGKYVMNANAKVMMEHTERSFIKLIFHKETKVLLGAQLMCPRATDMIAELADGVVHERTMEELLYALRPHPTFVEAVAEAIEAAEGKSLHSL